MKFVRYGPEALLLRFAQRADEAAFLRGRALLARLERENFDGLLEFVPAFTTLLLRFQDVATRDMGRELIEHYSSDRSLASGPKVPDRLVQVPVHYAGPDLARVAEHAGLSIEEVIATHAEPVYRVHCLGFTPGFPYLGGLDPRLQTPRLATPRVRVRAGSVAIGGEHTGIYSVPSAGGWNLIGETNTVLFEPQGVRFHDLFKLHAGDRVQFIRAPRLEPAPRAPALASEIQPQVPGALRVVSPGLGLTLQDFGRPGLARFGVPPGGPMDVRAAMWANRLVDNQPNAAVLELCLQGQRLEILRDGWLAVTGGNAPRGQSRNHAFRARAGEILEFGPEAVGTWSYLAVCGGFAGEVVLGSRSVNPRAGIGRGAAADDELGALEDRDLDVPDAVAGRVVPWDEVTSPAVTPEFRVWTAPQADLFSAADRQHFFSAEWTVSSQCDRVGYRLVGSAFETEVPQIISEPVLPGSIQVPAGGQPIITMPDGPTLGGYPKLGLVDPTDLPRLAQCRPGQQVRFKPVG